MASARASGGDKRRMILDAAVIAFAKRGFHACRVSDIADEANVAYGLVYHYFRSKDEVLDTLFVERWNILLDFISETDRQPLAPRDKLHAIAAAIIDFYRYDPALMKVIIVEVMRSANSFGMRHSDKIVRGLRAHRGDRFEGTGGGHLQARGVAALRGARLLRRDRAGPDGLDLRDAPRR